MKSSLFRSVETYPWASDHGSDRVELSETLDSVGADACSSDGPGRKREIGYSLSFYNNTVKRSGECDECPLRSAEYEKPVPDGNDRLDANCRTVTGLVRMLKPWFSLSSTILRYPRLSAIRTPAVMYVSYATTPQWSSRSSNQRTPSYHIYNKNVIRSERDERDYRVIRLQNGLEAMLVHDIKADKAAASLDVAVGHLYDPVCFVSTFGVMEWG